VDKNKIKLSHAISGSTIKYFIGFLFFLLSVATYGQSNATLPKDVVKSIEKRIELGLNPSIVIGIVDKDGMHYFNFGKKSDYGSAADEHTIYEIGSITKTFTAILLAQQEIDGKLKIDDPIKNYLPSQVKVPQRGKKEITFGNLSDHTSGLPRDAGNFSWSMPENYTVDSMYSFLSGYKLRRNVGSGFRYSNLAQGLLGHILALNVGITYESMMIKTIASPLGMNETKITLDEEMKKNLAIGHYNGAEAPNLYIPTLAGAGAIRSSTYDMLKFLAANMGLIQTPLQSAMNKTHEVRRNPYIISGRIGLAWAIYKGVISHDGGTLGFCSFAGFDKRTGKGVVVLTNSRESVDDIGLHLLNPRRCKLRQIKPSIAFELKKIIDSNGVEASKNHFFDLKKNNPKKSEDIINKLGYSYMEKNINTALAIFKINVEMYPNSSNVYDSYGEALMKNGQLDLAIENYKKSVELNPGNGNGILALEKMGVKIRRVEISETILQTYIGTYQFNPGYNLVITREGKHLFGQGTSQEKFELFAQTEKRFFTGFYEFIFNTKGKKGTVESLTIIQNGKKNNLKKIK
jgi:serine-type D-Ala-D-Ala carboxypeptidase/endopeptidase